MQTAAVLFDMDGVLVDSYNPHWHSWQATCAERGVRLTEEQYMSLFGSSFREFVAVLAPHMDDTQIEQWHADKEQRYRQAIDQHFPEMPGASALVRSLKQARFRIGVASSGPRENVNTLLRQLAAGPDIEASSSASEVARGKPFPDVFLACADKLGLPPGNCIVVEDSLHGLEAARAAGMPSIALVGTCSRSQLEPHAALVVDQLSELTVDAFRRLREHSA